MHYSVFVILSMIIFFALMLSVIAIGNLVGRRKLAASGLTVTEGAVFTLMALLIAFAFNGASQRYDQRRIMIVDESNAISTAYLRLDMLQPSNRTVLREDFLSYINSRLAIYEALPDLKAAYIALNKSHEIQAKLWSDAINACKNADNPMVNMLILPTINTMFDIANSRISFSSLHPPLLIIALLIIVALLSAFLTGYGIAGKGTWHSVHVLAYAIIITLTICIYFDLEEPRFGLINESEFDAFLIDVKNNMSKS